MSSSGSAPATTGGGGGGGNAAKASNNTFSGDKGDMKNDKSKQTDVRSANIIAAKAVADTIRTSLGPRGMDKMIQDGDGEVLITNDGATILSHMQVFHPTAKMLVELSKAQDIEAGDGTTSVVVLCGSLLDQCTDLLAKGIHPTVVSESYQLALQKALEVLEGMSLTVALQDKDRLIDAATTSLASKVVSQSSTNLAPLAVEAVLKVTDAEKDINVDLNKVRVTKALGGTVDETELVDGLVFTRKASHVAGAPTKKTDAKVGLIQFHLSAPKTDVEGTVVVSEYTDMDRILREERKYILGLCKKIAKTGCNVLLVQKSILRDAVTDQSLHFLAKLGIMVVRDVERDDVEFIAKTVGCTPVSHIDHFTADKLGHAAVCEEVSVGAGTKVIKMTGVPNPGKTVSLLVRGSNKLVLDEAERSLHDALCVVRSIVKKKALIVGGGAPETEIALALTKWSSTLSGAEAYCVRAFAEALDVIPYTLAENAGMNPIAMVTALRKKHAEGDKKAGINVKKGIISDMEAEEVLQPLLVSTSALTLATETVSMILKIDDIVASR